MVIQYIVTHKMEKAKKYFKHPVNCFASAVRWQGQSPLCGLCHKEVMRAHKYCGHCGVKFYG